MSNQDNISLFSHKSGAHSKTKRLRAHVDYNEMTVKYGRISLGVPHGFKACLENVTREVLRENPSDIPAFLACYFTTLSENQKSGNPASNLVTERIVEIKKEVSTQKEEEKAETADASIGGSLVQIQDNENNTSESQADLPAIGQEMSFEQQQELEHQNDEEEVGQTEEVQEVEAKPVCLEDLLQNQAYVAKDGELSFEEQEKIEHQVEEENVPEDNADVREDEAKAVCMEDLLKQKQTSQENVQIEEDQPEEQSPEEQSREEQSPEEQSPEEQSSEEKASEEKPEEKPEKVQSAPSTNEELKNSKSTAGKTQSEPAVAIGNSNKNNSSRAASAASQPSHISVDKLPEGIKMVNAEAIVTESVTELAAATNNEQDEEGEKQENEEQEQPTVEKIASLEQIEENNKNQEQVQEE